jgi:ubiquinone/menaquinone biosynthesis C-methylase UbiE
MRNSATILNEQQAEIAFNNQAVVFDELYTGNAIVNYKRARVREHVLKYLKPNSYVLELNSGTGEDAIFFAQRGHQVHATDISKGMQQELVNKVKHNQFDGTVTNELCSFTQLHLLKNKGPYDLVFSNFAGLNCTGELDLVLDSFSSLLKPGGMVTLVILPEFCLWETLLLFNGKFRTAFRRFFSSKGRTAHIEDTLFKCWYYNPSYITKKLERSFDVLSIEGLCTLVPPSYVEGFAKKHAVAYRYLKEKEDQLKTRWPWRCIGDYYIISLVKR